MQKLPRLVIALGVVSLLTDVSSEMILPLLPSLLIAGMGAGAVSVGLLDGIGDAVSAVLKRIAGGMSDRFPRRKPFVLAGYLLSTVVRPSVAFAALPWQVLGVRAIDRVGKGVRTAPRDALIGDAVAAADAPRAYAFHRMMDHTGAVVGPLIAAALLYVGLSARQTIAAAWIPGFLAVFAIVFLLDEKPRDVSAAVAAAKSNAPKPNLPSSFYPWLAVFGLFALGVAGDSFVVVHARELGVADPLLPVLWAVLHVAKVLAARQVGRRNTASKGVLVAAWLAGAAGLAILAVPDARIVWLGAIVLGVCHGTREPIERALVRIAAPDEARGRAFGQYHLVIGLLALPSGLGIGLLWDRFGGATALFASAVVVAIAAAALALLPRR